MCSAGSTTSLDHEFLRHTHSGATSSNHSDSDSLHNAQVHFRQEGSATQSQSSSPASSSSASLAASAILELVLEDKPVAVAIRENYTSSPGQQAATSGPQTSSTAWHQDVHANCIRQDDSNSTAVMELYWRLSRRAAYTREVPKGLIRTP